MSMARRGDGAQGFGVHEGRQARSRLGHLVLARQLGQRLAGDGLRRRGARGVLQRHAQQEASSAGRPSGTALPCRLDLVQRRLGDVDVAALDQLGHLAVEEVSSRVRMWAPSTSASVMMMMR
jgi:hypothetical protein